MLRKWKQMLHSGYFVRLLWMVLLSIIAALVVFAAVIYTSYGTLYLSSLSSRGQTTAAEICGGLESALMDYSTACLLSTSTYSFRQPALAVSSSRTASDRARLFA